MSDARKGPAFLSTEVLSVAKTSRHCIRNTHILKCASLLAWLHDGMRNNIRKMLTYVVTSSIFVRVHAYVTTTQIENEEHVLTRKKAPVRPLS